MDSNAGTSQTGGAQPSDGSTPSDSSTPPANHVLQPLQHGWGGMSDAMAQNQRNARAQGQYGVVTGKQTYGGND